MSSVPPLSIPKVSQMTQLNYNAGGSSVPVKRPGDDLMAMLAQAKKLRPMPVSTGLRLGHDGSDIDAVVRFHSDKIRSGVEDISQRHCGEILSTVIRRINEKETELDIAKKKNDELESKLKEIMKVCRTWYDVAKNGEAAACGLKASLDRALRSVRRVDDAGSRCFEGEASRGWGKSCTVCRNRDVSVLVLPCRHLCLCKECEQAADACPICRTKKSGGVIVFID